MMKRTEITYKKVNKVLLRVISIKNVAMSGNLPPDYLSGTPRYYSAGSCCGGRVVHLITRGGSLITLMEGSEYEYATFGYIINIMQQAGERLSNILYKNPKWGPNSIHIIQKESLGNGIYRLLVRVEKDWIKKQSKIIRKKNKDGSITLII